MGRPQLGRRRRGPRLILIGDGRYLTQAEGEARVALRRAVDEADRFQVEGRWAVIQALADQFQDTTVRAGCIRSGKLRRDRLYVEIYLVRRILGMPPRRIAEVVGLSDRYLRFSLERGRLLLQAARNDGRLVATLGQLDSPEVG
jgi:hypothetical protein